MYRELYDLDPAFRHTLREEATQYDTLYTKQVLVPVVLEPGCGRKTKDIWRSMLRRCTNPKDAGYMNYGGRGITVCERWLVYGNFKADMGLKPKGLSLDRIDNDKGYSPENCRWADDYVRNRNQRTRKDNTSGVRGVQWNPSKKKWQVFVMDNGVKRQLYYGEDFQEACRIRKEWEDTVW
jgi:hypothetical protein